MKNDIMETIRSLIASRNHGITCIENLEARDPENRWAIVSAWVDYDNDNHWRVYAKVAFKPRNSIMDDYDWDWVMPYDKQTGEVWDTETEVNLVNLESAVDWLLEQWDEIAKERQVAA